MLWILVLVCAIEDEDSFQGWGFHVAVPRRRMSLAVCLWQRYSLDINNHNHEWVLHSSASYNICDQKNSENISYILTDFNRRHCKVRHPPLSSIPSLPLSPGICTDQAILNPQTCHATLPCDLYPYLPIPYHWSAFHVKRSTRSGLADLSRYVRQCRLRFADSVSKQEA